VGNARGHSGHREGDSGGVPRMPALKAKLTPEGIAAVARYAQQLASGKP
jgi:hypothetical protein